MRRELFAFVAIRLPRMQTGSGRLETLHEMANRREQLARRSTEQTVATTIDALGDLCDSFGGIGQSNELRVGMQSNLSPAEASLLQDMLPYYDKVAWQLVDTDGSRTQSVMRQAHRALMTVSAIEMQVARYPEAIVTFERALAQLPRMVSNTNRRLALEAEIRLDIAGANELIDGEPDSIEQSIRTRDHFV